VNQPTEFYISTFDAYGNKRLDSPEVPSVTILPPISSANFSVAPFGSVLPGGLYVFAMTSAIEMNVSVLFNLNDAPVTVAPIYLQFKLITGPPDAHQSSVFFPVTVFTCGSTTNLVLTLRDSLGIPFKASSDSDAASALQNIRVLVLADAIEVPFTIAADVVLKGNYFIRFTPTKSAVLHVLSVKYLNQPILGSPYIFIASPGVIDVNSSAAFGALSVATAGILSTVSVISRDKYMNAREPASEFKVFFATPRGTIELKQNSASLSTGYLFSYITTLSALYTLSVFDSVESVHIPGSPFRINVLPAVASPDAS